MALREPAQTQVTRVWTLHDYRPCSRQLQHVVYDGAVLVLMVVSCRLRFVNCDWVSWTRVSKASRDCMQEIGHMQARRWAAQKKRFFRGALRYMSMMRGRSELAAACASRSQRVKGADSAVGSS